MYQGPTAFITNSKSPIVRAGELVDEVTSKTYRASALRLNSSFHPLMKQNGGIDYFFWNAVFLENLTESICLDGVKGFGQINKIHVLFLIFL